MDNDDPPAQGGIGRPTEPGVQRGEHWWPVGLAVLVAGLLHVALPSRYRVSPPWITPAVLVALLLVLVVGDPGRIDRRKRWLRVVTEVMIAFLTGANLFAGGQLVADILTNAKLFANNATGLLATGGVVWVTNVIAFALWYWDLDRGGAAARAHRAPVAVAFVFPEMQQREHAPPHWVPAFVDYLSLSFWTATAFSPTDVSAVRPWSKLMMMLEAASSLILGGLVVARAVNILQ